MDYLPDDGIVVATMGNEKRSASMVLVMIYHDFFR